MLENGQYNGLKSSPKTLQIERYHWFIIELYLDSYRTTK